MPDPGTDPHFVIEIILEGQNIFNGIPAPPSKDYFIVRNIKRCVPDIICLGLSWQAVGDRKLIIKTELLLESQQVPFALEYISSYI